MLSIFSRLRQAPANPQKTCASNGFWSAWSYSGQNRTRGCIGVGKAIDGCVDVLEHGGPEISQWGVLLRGHAVLTVFEAFESAAGQQAGHIDVAMTSTKTASALDQAVVENRSAVGIQGILAAAELVEGCS